MCCSHAARGRGRDRTTQPTPAAISDGSGSRCCRSRRDFTRCASASCTDCCLSTSRLSCRSVGGEAAVSWRRLLLLGWRSVVVGLCHPAGGRRSQSSPAARQTWCLTHRLLSSARLGLPRPPSLSGPQVQARQASRRSAASEQTRRGTHTSVASIHTQTQDDHTYANQRAQVLG